MVERVVRRRVGEPFPAWRDNLIAAFRALRPELSGSNTRRYKIGRVARMVMLGLKMTGCLPFSKVNVNGPRSGRMGLNACV